MKEEKPRLVLNKRTIAHLNNLEMRNVRGGDGGEISKGFCDEKDKIDSPVPSPGPEIPTAIKNITTIFATRVAC